MSTKREPTPEELGEIAEALGVIADNVYPPVTLGFKMKGAVAGLLQDLIMQRNDWRDNAKRLRYWVKYAEHKNTCNEVMAWGRGPHKCDCGLAEAIAAHDKMVEDSEG